MRGLTLKTVLAFWATVFAGLAYLTFKVPAMPLSGTPGSEFSTLLATANSYALMSVMLLMVAVLFAWAALSGFGQDEAGVREVETYAYAGGILAMGVCVVIGFHALAALRVVPTVLTAMLATSAAASRFLPLDERGREEADEISRHAARMMALGAAHTTMLARVSGRSTMRGEDK